MQIQINKMERELKIRNYSLKTIKDYLGCLREFFDFNLNWRGQ